jgi:hypothetical protein
VFGVFPHLHGRGQALTLEAGGDCLVDAPTWDYRWQEAAWFTTPRPLSSGTPLRLSCTWNTEDADGITVWGESAEDEMCMVFLLAAGLR